MFLKNCSDSENQFLSQTPSTSSVNTKQNTFIIISITNKDTGSSKLFCDRVIPKVLCLQCEQLFQNMRIKNGYPTVKTQINTLNS